MQISHTSQTPLDKIFSLDLETRCRYGTDCHKGIKCKHALYPHHAEITVIGIHNDTYSTAYWTLKSFSDWLDSHPDALFVGQNLSFDLRHLAYHDIYIAVDRWVGDTQLMGTLNKEKVSQAWLQKYEAKRKEINKSLPKGKRHRNAREHSLKTMAPYFLGVNKFWEAVEDHANEDYVLKDAAYAWELYKLFTEHLRAQGSLNFYEKYQQPWARAMHQLGGVELDLEGLAQLEKAVVADVAVLKEKLLTLWHYGAEARYNLLFERTAQKYQLMAQTALNKTKTPGREAEIINKYNELQERAQSKLKRELNIDSAAQMLWLFKEFYKWNVKSLDGTTSTGKTLLQKMADEGHEDAQLFLQYKKQKKLLTGFIEPYKELQYNGKLYPTFNSLGARTGRTSCSGPNLQQCPPSIRKLIRAGADKKFITMDMSTVEPRLVAYFSEDPQLVKLFQQHGDFHGATAVICFNLPCSSSEVKQLYKSKRDDAKEMGLSVLYGAGAIRLKLVGQKRGHSWSEDECKEFIKRIRSGYAGAAKYKKQLDKQAELGPIKSIFGQQLWYPDKDDIYMKAFNTQIQGSSSQLVVQAVSKLQQQFKQLSMQSRVVLAVHDEIVVEAPDDEILVAKQLVTDCMTGYNLETKYGKVPLEVEGGVSQIWSK